MTSTFPYGYAGTRLTLEQLLQRETVRRGHPEFVRRVINLMQAAAANGVELGIGTLWRVQPNPPPAGFASPGNSNHEGFPAGPGSTGAIAADMVGNLDWMEAHLLPRGLKSFRNVNREPWHIQPLECPNARNWRTTPWQLLQWNLPDTPQPPPSPPPAPPAPPTAVRTFTMQLTKTELRPENRDALRGNPDVWLFQQICQGHVRQFRDSDPARSEQYDCGTPDGDYGPRTQQAATRIQADGGLDRDGFVGPQTWRYVLNG